MCDAGGNFHTRIVESSDAEYRYCLDGECTNDVIGEMCPRSVNCGSMSVAERNLRS